MKACLIVILLFFGTTVLADGKPEVVLTTGHPDYINAMVTSPDGRFLVSAGNEKIIKVWDIATGQEYRTLSGMDGRTNQLIFANDSRHLAAMTTHNELIVWDVISGEEKYKHMNAGILSGVAFSTDGTKLYHSSVSTLFGITDLESGDIRETSTVCMSLALDTVRNMIYSYDNKGNIVHFSLESESEVAKVKVFDEFLNPFTGSDITPDGRYMATGFQDDILRIYDPTQQKFIYESPPFGNKIKDLKFDPIAPLLYLADGTGTVTVFDYQEFKVVRQFKEDVFATQCLTAHPRGNTIILANNNVIRFYDVKQKKTFKKMGGKVAAINNMAYDPNGDFLAVASDKINIDIWDLKLNKRITKIKGFFPCVFSPDGNYLIAQNFNTNLGVWDVNTGDLKRELSTGYMMQNGVSVSADGKLVAGAGLDMHVRIWDIESGKEIAKLGPHIGIVNEVDFHPTEPWVAAASYGTSDFEQPPIKVWDYEKQEVIAEFNDQHICASDCKFSQDGKYLATSAWDKTIVLRETESWTTVHKFTGHTNMVTSIDFNAEGTLLVSAAANNAVAEYDNSVRFWDVKTGKEKCVIQDHHNGVTKVIFDETNGRAFSASMDGTVKINDPESCEVIATYVAVNGEDFMIYTPDNYYMASKNALKGVAFRIDEQLVPFEQFDAYLNRPDIVAARIDKSPPQLIKAYEYLHKKRMRKLKLDEGELQIDYKIPRIKFDSPLELVTTDEHAKFWVKAWDDTYPLKQINVFVNDVPVYGEQGIPVDGKVKSIRKQFEIPLLKGENRIQISCVNSNGAESLYQTKNLIREGDATKNDLYLVAIGVSNYQDSRFNLTYPTKDATDVVSKMKESSDLYNNIHTKMLLNEEATANNFEALRDFFKNSTHEDLAVIFIAGHGVLDANFDYYYGTFDMDFNEPAKKGLPYDRIHALLNDLKPYKKLLIMDTCHSGELDKEEIEEGPPAEIEEGDVEFRAAGVAVRKKPGFGFDNSVEMMQDMFSDTRKGSGATVISSAGGAEFAMESDSWKNGLFTYTFLEGLEKPSTDQNQDNMIQVSEIRSYVNKQVKKLSKGKQIPSSREENISQDYIIFGH